MKIAMIGGGSVGQALGAKLTANGHDVVIGIRSLSADELAKDRANALPLKDWITQTGGGVMTMAKAAAHGEIVFNVTAGKASLDALRLAGEQSLRGKILIDVANALDFSRGMPPFLDPELTTTTSLGEEIQKTFPDTHVVKALNTVANAVMVNPGLVPGDHSLPIAGNSAKAKATVTALLQREFGWPATAIVDLGDIVGARATEHLLPLWIRLWMVGGTPNVNIGILRG